MAVGSGRRVRREPGVVWLVWGGVIKAVRGAAVVGGAPHRGGCVRR